jgi:hypothetical protein
VAGAPTAADGHEQAGSPVGAAGNSVVGKSAVAEAWQLAAALPVQDVPGLAWRRAVVVPESVWAEAVPAGVVMSAAACAGVGQWIASGSACCRPAERRSRVDCRAAPSPRERVVSAGCPVGLDDPVRTAPAAAPRRDYMREVRVTAEQHFDPSVFPLRPPKTAWRLRPDAAKIGKAMRPGLLPLDAIFWKTSARI